MYDLLLKDGYVLTMKEDGEKIKRGDVGVKENKIAEVGKDLGENADTIIDAQEKAVLPGLINAHTHLSMVLFRGIGDDLPLQSWLSEKIWPREEKLKAEHVRDGAMLGCLEMIKSGTTCFADLYFFMDQVAKAVKKSGLRANLAYGIIEQNDEEKRRKEIEIGKSLVKDYEGAFNGRIRTMLGPHSTYTCSPKCLKETKKIANNHGVGIHIHLAENEKEIETVMDMHGERPIELLDSLNLLGPNVLAAHCTWANEKEIELLERNGVKAVHNPVSNMKLGSGTAPLPEMVSNGVTVGLGTDGAASNNTLDMMKEMKFAALLHKVQKRDPTVIPARKALEMATIDSAKALGWEEEIGSIEVGKKADIILIDLKKPHLTPVTNIESHIVYCCNGADVDTVIVDGNILMQRRNLITLDEEKTIKKCELSAKDISRRVK
ncbi:MAG: amidohydrolase [Candidatus Hadarchaeia archaeon]